MSESYFTPRSDADTPPQYRGRIYRREGSLHPYEPEGNSVHLMMKRIALQLGQQNLSEDGKRAFSAWLDRLVREESVWATGVTPEVRRIIIARLNQIFAEEFPDHQGDKVLIEDALYRELRLLDTRNDQ